MVNRCYGNRIYKLLILTVVDVLQWCGLDITPFCSMHVCYRAEKYNCNKRNNTFVAAIHYVFNKLHVTVNI